MEVRTVDTGFYPADNRSTVLSPDVAFTTNRASACTRTFKTVGALAMPDIAVEVKSPNYTLSLNCDGRLSFTLKNGTQLVWIVMPELQRRRSQPAGRKGQHSNANSSARTAASPANPSCPALSWSSLGSSPSSETKRGANGTPRTFLRH